MGSRQTSAATAAPNALSDIDHIIVIYQENWSFDGLYGNFPGADGLLNASHRALNQKDRLNGKSLAVEIGPDTYINPSKALPIQDPPQPLNSAGVIDTIFPNDLYTLLPYQLLSYVDPTYITGDIVHRFWQEQLQGNHGQNNYFITWSDNPGLVMSHFDATNLPEGLLAQQYTISDAFFHSAFGGSFLNQSVFDCGASPRLSQCRHGEFRRDREYRRQRQAGIGYEW
jgi:phospholipase C